MLVNGKQDAAKVVGVANEQNSDEPNVSEGNGLNEIWLYFNLCCKFNFYLMGTCLVCVWFFLKTYIYLFIFYCNFKVRSLEVACLTTLAESNKLNWIQKWCLDARA